MRIKPSNYITKHALNQIHFYLLLLGVPVTVILTIINIRANPELIEIPDGYEPRHWEYYKHPISRWIARYLYYPMETEYEARLGLQEWKAEAKIASKVSDRVDRVMKFYNDHRSANFTPGMGAEYIRKGRASYESALPATIMMPGHVYDEAYSDSTMIPVEGYKDGPIDGM